MSKKVNYRELANWDVSLWMNDNDTASHETLTVAALFGIRDELRKLNSLLHCPNFTAIPRKLDRIGRNTARKRKPRVVGKPKLRVVR